MAFIDIFNFKKYFTTPSDSQVARYGHINILAKRITDPVTATQISEEDLNINAYVGKINLPTIATETTKTLFITNNLVTENSVVLVSIGNNAGVDFVVGITAIALNGAISVSIVNSSPDYDLITPVLNFLIIN